MPLIGPPLHEPIYFEKLLEPGLSARPDAPALVSAEMSWTWRELDAACDRYACGLLALGLKPGDRVASLMPNRTALLLHYIGCIRAGLIAVPLNYRYMPPEMDHALEVSEASVLVYHAERRDDVAASRWAGQLPLGAVVYGAEGEGGGGVRRMEDLIDRPPAQWELPSYAPDDPVFILFTSGSTGKPKGVTHTRASFGWMLASFIASCRMSGEDIILPAHSASHVGAIMISLAGLAAGARVDVARTFDAHEVLPLLRNTRPTCMCMLPAPLITLTRDHDATADDFTSLRLCISGGDKVSATLEREFTELAGLAIDECYGMTEHGISLINPIGGPIKIGSIGMLGAGYRVCLRDEDGNEVPVNQNGRMWVKSNANMIGYWNRPDATAETIVDGWLDTGDVVSVDDEGYFFFHGRKKQIIVHDGSNICPQEVEESLQDHPAVEAAGVIGIYDLVHGENVRAYVVLKPGAEAPRAHELIAFSRERVGYKAPEQIVFLDEMPLNATGKTDRVTLKQMAADEHGHSVA